MINMRRSSRTLYGQYRQQVQRRKTAAQAGKDAPALPAPPVVHGPIRLAELRSIRRHRSFTRLFMQFWTLLHGHKTMIALALATLSLATLVGLVPPYGSKIILDSVVQGRPLPGAIPDVLHLPSDRRALLRAVACAMIGVACVSMLIGTWSRWQATRITKRVQIATRTKLFEHAVRLPLHRVYELKSGGVTSILREDAGSAGDLVFSLLYNPWRAIVQLCGTLVILALADFRLLLGAMLLMPTVWLTHRTWIGRIRPLMRDIRSTRQGIDGHATEAFGGMRVVRSFGRQRTETGTFTRGNHLMARQEVYTWWWSRGIEMAWGVMIPVASALLLWYGAGRIMDDLASGAPDPLTVGDLIMFLFYLTSLLGPIAALAESATGLQNHLAGLDRALDLLDEPSEMPSTEASKVLKPTGVQGRVTIRNLAFTYKGSERPVLQEIDLDVLPGETIALVGPSGAGKTTLCNLIARFYDPTSGAVLLDGTDLRDIDVDSYRRLLGIVEQDTFLFDGTIAQNIAYGRKHTTMEDVIHAAKQANAHEFIGGLERGYDTLIGERGVKLSGGQRQRLTIARAILADPRILILDEATSNLDTESERLIQSSLAALMGGRTSFVIAHRLSTVAGADRIVVIDKGRIIEVGSHDELMGRSSRYRMMVELQTRPTQERIDDTAEESTAQPAA
jgi:ATP-binding cassette subfamily B protein/subfamily B ATP-binding cassette protein MsbA